MNAQEAREKAANSQIKVRQNILEGIDAMARNGFYFYVASTHYPELIEEFNQLGYDTKVNEWGSLEISWKLKN